MAELPRGDFCPVIKGKCKGLECVDYVELKGTNKQTGEPTSDWMCSRHAHLVILMDIARACLGTGVAVESFRNEMVEANKAANLIQAVALRQKLLGEDDEKSS